MKTFISLILIFCSIGLVTLSLIQLGEIDFIGDLTKKPAKENFNPLFDGDLPASSKISMRFACVDELTMSYNTKNGIWSGSEPWQDRADGPKAIMKLLSFIQAAEIQDHLRASPPNLKKLGFDDEAIAITITDRKGDIIEDFTLGKSSAWFKNVEAEVNELIPTVYLRSNKPDENKFIYLCTDASKKIHSLFVEKGELFRDHRPFALQINALQKELVINKIVCIIYNFFYCIYYLLR